MTIQLEDKMAPGVDLNISLEIWREYRIFIEKLKKKAKDNTISASKRIEEFIKSDMIKNKID